MSLISLDFIENSPRYAYMPNRPTFTGQNMPVEGQIKRFFCQYANRLFAQPWLPLNKSVLRESVDWKHPGVYALAHAGRRHAICPKDNLDKVLYVGMTRASYGIKGRLEHFLSAIEKGKGHSGGDRFFREYSCGVSFSKLRSKKKFYFVALPMQCETNAKIRSPRDLQVMAHITCTEYYVLSEIKRRIGREPPLNKQ